MWKLKLSILSLVILLSTTCLHASGAHKRYDSTIKSSVFLSPPFFLRPGSVVNRVYFNIPFPGGHIALKSFDAEVIDEFGISVPLHETYLHHWVVESYYGEKGKAYDLSSNFSLVRNAGVCKGALGQYFGLGSETRRTSTWVPGPYGIEVGNPKEIPDGYDQNWLLNIHAIDTRGVEDRSGCTECKCNLYNVTKNEFNRPLRKDYIGGLHCCYDDTQCRMREGMESQVVRKLYLRYAVQWLDWDETIVPVKIYIFDITDTREMLDGSSEETAGFRCKVEYNVEPCKQAGEANGMCIDNKKTRAIIPRGGNIVYGVAHQHSGGIGSALYGQDGRVLCSSMPTYGQGKEAGNEAGYIVGMSTCYPKPGSVRIGDGELLTVESNYSSNRLRTGVMGLFYILVADPQPQRKSIMIFNTIPVSWGLEVEKYWWALALFGGILAAIIGFSSCRRSSGAGYQSL